ILKPDQPWEQEGGPAAMVFSDGVWYDPADRLFKMWYMGGLTRATCLATSKDGLRWEKPVRDVKKGTNVVQPDPRDSVTVWLDLDEKDAQRRYKLFRSWRDKASSTGWNQTVYFSGDGVHWGEPGHRALIPVAQTHGNWNWGNVQSAGGGCLVVGDQLYFYVSGRAGVKGSPASGVSTTGLAVLRRDGFASMGAGAEER